MGLSQYIKIEGSDDNEHLFYWSNHYLLSEFMRNVFPENDFYEKIYLNLEIISNLEDAIDNGFVDYIDNSIDVNIKERSFTTSLYYKEQDLLCVEQMKYLLSKKRFKNKKIYYIGS